MNSCRYRTTLAVSCAVITLAHISAASTENQPAIDAQTTPLVDETQGQLLAKVEQADDASQFSKLIGKWKIGTSENSHVYEFKDDGEMIRHFPLFSGGNTPNRRITGYGTERFSAELRDGKIVVKPESVLEPHQWFEFSIPIDPLSPAGSSFYRKAQGEASGTPFILSRVSAQDPKSISNKATAETGQEHRLIPIIKPAEAPIYKSGKRIGQMPLPAGTPVQIMGRTKSGALVVKHGVGAEPFLVPTDAIGDLEIELPLLLAAGDKTTPEQEIQLMEEIRAYFGQDGGKGTPIKVGYRSDTKYNGLNPFDVIHAIQQNSRQGLYRATKWIPVTTLLTEVDPSKPLYWGSIKDGFLKGSQIRNQGSSNDCTYYTVRYALEYLIYKHLGVREEISLASLKAAYPTLQNGGGNHVGIVREIAKNNSPVRTASGKVYYFNDITIREITGRSLPLDLRSNFQHGMRSGFREHLIANELDQGNPVIFGYVIAKGAPAVLDKRHTGAAGTHASMIVSYKSDGPAENTFYEFANTWGTGWGFSGFGWVSEAKLQRITDLIGGDIFSISGAPSTSP